MENDFKEKGAFPPTNSNIFQYICGNLEAL